MPRRTLYASGVRALAIARAQTLCRGRRAPGGTAILLVAPLFRCSGPSRTPLRSSLRSARAGRPWLPSPAALACH